LAPGRHSCRAGPLHRLVFFAIRARRTPEGSGAGGRARPTGTIVEIEELDYDEYIGGPALSLGIFLSVFNVHINRVPVAARIIGLSYRKGKFLNAMLPASARENERLSVRIEERPPFLTAG